MSMTSFIYSHSESFASEGEMKMLIITLKMSLEVEQSALRKGNEKLFELRGESLMINALEMLSKCLCRH